MNKKKFRQMLNKMHPKDNRFVASAPKPKRPWLLVAMPVAVAALAVAVAFPFALHSSSSASTVPVISNRAESSATTVGPANTNEERISSPRAEPEASQAITVHNVQENWEIDDYKLNAPKKEFNTAQDALNDDFVAGLQGFAKKFASVAYDEKTNPIYSPLSIAAAFSMLYEGAMGESKSQLSEAFGYGGDFKPSEEMKKTLLQDALSLTDTNKEETCYLNVSQSLFIDDDFSSSINTDFVELMTSDYFAEVFGGVLADSPMHEVLASWINEKTRDFLKVTPDSFKDYAGVMWLVNTIYLKTVWKNADIDEQTYKMTFVGIDGTNNKVDSFKLGIGEEVYIEETFSLARIPLEGGLTMNILLPKQGEPVNSPVFYDGLCKFKQNPMNNAFKPAIVEIPKFRSQQKYDLIPIMSELGINDIFTEEANLSGIADDLYVGKTAHEAGIEVTECGVEAAAYTIIQTEKGVNAGPSEDYIELTFNRPFLYSILDNAGLPLFIGAVNSL